MKTNRELAADIKLQLESLLEVKKGNDIEAILNLDAALLSTVQALSEQILEEAA